MNLTTPALLFPAISLLLLAYTNRFLVLAQLIRQLHDQNRSDLGDVVIRQISNLRKRLALIRSMQALGVSSFILCSLSMFFLFVQLTTIAELSFGLSLALLVVSPRSNSKTWKPGRTKMVRPDSTGSPTTRTPSSFPTGFSG